MKKALGLTIALVIIINLLGLTASAEESSYSTTTIDGHRTNYVTIDMSSGVEANMMLANDTMDSTQTVADMAKENGAFAAINGTYFSAYEDPPVPWGTIIKDGKLIHTGDGAVAGFTSSGRFLVDRVTFHFRGYVNGKLQFVPWRLNHPSVESDAITIFTPEYKGTITCASGAQVVLVESTGIVSKILEGAFSVPNNGFAVVFNSSVAYLAKDRIQVGDRVTYETEARTTFTAAEDWDDVTAAVGAGPSLIINGVITADGAAEGFTEEKINLERAGRSFLGATADGEVRMGTISNATIAEAAAVCQKLSLVNALCLDGGGSSALYYNGSKIAGRETNNALGFFRAEVKEYIYDTIDPGESVVLPVELLANIKDTRSATNAVRSLTDSMTEGQKASPVGADLAALYAETASARVASKAINSADIVINASAISSLGTTAEQATQSVSATLKSGGVSANRSLSKIVTLTTTKTDISVQIDPNVLTTGVDKVRVETPAYAATFKLQDLSVDLTQSLTFHMEDVGTDSSAGGEEKAAVKVDMPGGKTTNSITVSLPGDEGDATYQAVVSADGTATTSKHNPATTTIDGKVNQSGTYAVKTNEKDFTDISNKSAEMQKAIRYLASKGIINGTSETTFSPDGSISRAEIATLLVKALGKFDSTATTSFSDVSKSNWYYAAAASSQRHGLISGYEDNTFRGATNISKVQIVAVSSRVLTKEMGYKVPSNPSTYLTKYKDSIADWAQSEVALATKENLVVYRTDGTFSGDKNMTRGDAAIIIYRLFQRIW